MSPGASSSAVRRRSARGGVRRTPGGRGYCHWTKTASGLWEWSRMGWAGIPLATRRAGLLATHSWRRSPALPVLPANGSVRLRPPSSPRTPRSGPRSRPRRSFGAWAPSALVATCFHSGGCDWVSVGDSFLFHDRSGRILARHEPARTRSGPSWTNGRGAARSPPRVQAAADPERALITSVVMGFPLDDVAEGSLPLEPGDLLILATDGVETLGEDGIAAVCGKQTGAGAEEVATAIIRRIEEIGSSNQDNAAVVVRRPST